MKKKVIKIMAAFALATSFASCTRVEPNYAGVLMENYGRDGKSDFSIVTGKVSVLAPGTELYQVPLFEQRGGFDKPITLKAADNTEFTANPVYSYKVEKSRAIDVVFDNKHVGRSDNAGENQDAFLEAVEDNVIEPRIYDLAKEESRKYKTDTLMADGGSLLFEKELESIVREELEARGFKLMSFSAQLEFSDKVREKIDSRNEVNTNISVLDQQIEEQKKRNELERLKTEQALIQSQGLTKEILYKQFIDKWDGKSSLYGIAPEFLKMTK